MERSFSILVSDFAGVVLMISIGDLAEEFFIIACGSVYILAAEKAQNEAEVSQDGPHLHSHDVSIELSDLDEIHEEHNDEDESNSAMLKKEGVRRTSSNISSIVSWSYDAVRTNYWCVF